MNGEIRACAHCDGTGKCDCKECQAGSGAMYTKVTCKVCGGKGSVWVGPLNEDS